MFDQDLGLVLLQRRRPIANAYRSGTTIRAWTAEGRHYMVAWSYMLQEWLDQGDPQRPIVRDLVEWVPL